MGEKRERKGWGWCCAHQIPNETINRGGEGGTRDSRADRCHQGPPRPLELAEGGRMKEFYALANKVMRIKRSNPVVNKVKRISDNGDVEIF